MDPLEWVARAPFPFLARCRIPSDLEEVTRVGEESAPRQARTTRGELDRLWGSVQALYRTGVYPGLQICVRRRGHIVLNRRACFAGDPETATAYIKEIEEKYPGVEQVMIGFPMGQTKAGFKEQLSRFAKEIIPSVKTQRVTA